MLQPDIRNTVRAVIIRDGYVLLQKKHDTLKGTRYTLPGGAQESGETLLQALQRECEEEIAVFVEAECIIHIADYFRHKTQPEPHIRQQLEILFLCRIPQSYVPKNGPKPDKSQVEVLWIPVDDLPQYNVIPSLLTEILPAVTNSDRPIYLGTIS
jgi:8-oxo-dGTP diphosphatase